MFSLYDGEMFEGDLPNKGQQLVKEFIKQHKEKLLIMWETQQFEELFLNE